MVNQVGNKRFYYGLIIVITVISFVLRLVSIDHNLPYQVISDEGSDLTTAVQLLKGELPARHVRYHRSLIAYSNLVPIAAVGLINFIDGDVRSLSDFEDLYFSNRAEFTYATRVWMALITSIAILLTGLAGAYLEPRIGVLATLVLALNGFFFHTSLFALPDALGASATALALWLIMRLANFGRSRDYILASLALALIMLAKLQAVTIGIGLLIAHGYIVYGKVEGDWRRFIPAYFLDKNLWIAAITGIIGNIIFNPLAFLNLDDFLFEIDRLFFVVYENQTDNFALKITIFQQEIGALLLIIWRWAFPLCLLGFYYVWKNRANRFYIISLAMFVVLFLTTFSSRFGPISHFYYWNPWIVLMALLSAIGLFGLWDSLGKSKLKALFWLILLAFILLEAWFFIHIFNIMNKPTTQELARDYIVNEIPANSRIFADDPIIGGVPLYRNDTSIERAQELTGTNLSQWIWWLEQEEAELPTPSYDIFGPEMSEVIDSFEDEIEIIKSNEVEYFIISDYCDGAHLSPESDSASAFPFYSDALVENWELLVEYSPFQEDACAAYIHRRTKLSFTTAIFQQERMGPYIRIYRIPN